MSSPTLFKSWPPPFLACLVTLLLLPFSHLQAADDSETRQILVDVVLGNDEERAACFELLSNKSDSIIETVVAAWRGGEISTVSQSGGEEFIVLIKSAIL